MFTKLFGLSIEVRFFINNNLKKMKGKYLNAHILEQIHIKDNTMKKDHGLFFH